MVGQEEDFLAFKGKMTSCLVLLVFFLVEEEFFWSDGNQTENIFFDSFQSAGVGGKGQRMVYDSLVLCLPDSIESHLLR